MCTQDYEEGNGWIFFIAKINVYLRIMKGKMDRNFRTYNIVKINVYPRL